MRIRSLLFVALVALLVAAAIWLADRPGMVAVEWLGWRLDTSVPVLLATLAVVVILLTVAVRVAAGLAGLPRQWLARRRETRRRRGYLALSDGLAAAATGDAGRTRHLAGRAERLLGDPALTSYLSARAAEMSGDGETAREHFRAMLERPETAALGVRGLLDAALQDNDIAGATELAERARGLSPDDGWLAETLFGLLVRQGEWQRVEELLADAERRKSMTPEALIRRRALLLNQRAARAEDGGDTRGALISAAKAFAADPTVTAAAVRLANLYAADGRRRKAVTVLEKAWRAAPAPELVRACADLPPVEDAVQRLRRVERLVAVGHAETPLGHLAIAEAALDAKIWGVARQHLLAARELQPGAGTYRLLARLEQAEYNDQAAAQVWLAKAETAPAEAGWTCGACAARPGAWSLVCPACGGVDSLAWN